jgi:glycosyltransferase involved in cell wall biosynthesis
MNQMSAHPIDISVVVPVYGCPGALPELHRRLTDTLSGLVDAYEIILVDDRCPKGSWGVVQELLRSDPHVRGVRLARNFGQARAITAGLDRARGQWAVVMDCDCQDPPEAIAPLYAKAREGYDVVFARRVGRKDSQGTLALSRAFYRVYSYLAETPVDPTVGNFSIVSRRALDAYLSMREQGRDYSLFMTWVGFEQAFVDIRSEERFEGKSSYTFGKKMSLAIESITAHSNKPLTMAVKFGFIMALLAFIMLVVLVIQHFVDQNVPMGWPSMVASVFLVGGIIVTVMGVVGIYVGNTFAEARNRPLYLVEEDASLEDDASGEGS